MGATSRSKIVREKKGHFSLYLRGAGIDIGCGGDGLKIPSGTVLLWDRSNGDANLLQGIAPAFFDFVYSSHSLEHMSDVGSALRRWVEVLKPGGSLFLVVPDFCLYEHLKWPSAFNGEHQFTFSLDLKRSKVGRSSHFQIWDDLVPVLSSLKISIMEVCLEDDGYDYNSGFVDQTLGDRALAQICIIGKKVS